jgi:hypothetical protein
MKALKELVREQLASGITDFRRVYDAIYQRWPGNRKRPSLVTVRRYCRELQQECRPSPEAQNANAVASSTGDSWVEHRATKTALRTITVRCDLRNLLTLASSHESVTLATAMGMGLVAILERLAKRAHELGDPELDTCLDLLCL